MVLGNKNIITVLIVIFLFTSCFNSNEKTECDNKESIKKPILFYNLEYKDVEKGGVIKEYNKGILINTIPIKIDSQGYGYRALISNPEILFSIKNEYELTLANYENKKIDIKINEIGTYLGNTMFTVTPVCRLKSYSINGIEINEYEIIIDKNMIDTLTTKIIN